MVTPAMGLIQALFWSVRPKVPLSASGVIENPALSVLA
jgi:hypothetical protein